MPDIVEMLLACIMYGNFFHTCMQGSHQLMGIAACSPCGAKSRHGYCKDTLAVETEPFKRHMCYEQR